MQKITRYRLMLLLAFFCTAVAGWAQHPDLLLFPDGTPVRDPSEWVSVRRPQILRQLRSEIYGHIREDHGLSVRYETVSCNEKALDGTAVLKQVDLVFSVGNRHKTVRLMLIVPSGVEKAPVFLAYNFHGNYTVTGEPEIPPTDKWVSMRQADRTVIHRAGERFRGSDSLSWNVPEMIRRGYALATAHYGDVWEDYPEGYPDSFGPLLSPPEKDSLRRPGQQAVWAWGLLRIMDYLQTEPLVDPHRVIVIGVSRLGKAALWAGAQDERFAAIVPHCAGGVVKAADRKDLLLALAAPRPFYSTTSEKDIYAVPELEFGYLQRAGSIYRFLGAEGIRCDTLPGICQPVRNGRIGFHIKPGGHRVDAYDWQEAMNFLDGLGFGKTQAP